MRFAFEYVGLTSRDMGCGHWVGPGDQQWNLLGRLTEGRVGLVTHRVPIALLKMRYQGLDPDIVRTLHLPNAHWEAIPLP